jgi:ectoine hydroxylase-related dioxygenase (phytanoyl-CoA dioxygenase family)
MLERTLKILASSLRMAAGGLAFTATGRTPASAYQSMIRLFMLTGGRSNDLAARWLSTLHPPYPLPAADGILGALSPARLESLVTQLNRDGYAVFERALPPEICDRLTEFAVTEPAHVRPTDADATAVANNAVYRRSEPLGIIYDFPPQSLIHHPDVQALLCDASILALAQGYIGAKPVLDEVNMWWSTSFGQEPDSAAAQYWHFDMDRLRWLKFFIYLTDVTERSGPHSFVRGSHRTGGIPAQLLNRGYVRLPDEDVAACYPREDFVEFVAPRGTVIVEDTRGLHKGKRVEKGDRLMLEFEFSGSLFGATPVFGGRLTRFHSAEFDTFVRNHPRTFRRWL